jgi:hypothetical protein
MLDKAGEIVVGGQQVPAAIDCLSGDESIYGRDRYASGAARVHKAGSLRVIVIVRQKQRERAEIITKLVELLLSANPGEKLLENNTGEDDGLVLCDHRLKNASSLRNGRVLAAGATKGMRPDGSIDDDQRAARAFL